MPLGELAGALEDARRGAALDPSNGSIMDTYGDMLCRNGRADEAMQEWKLSRAESGNIAAIKQELLDQQGFYSGPIDGDFGRESLAALRAWAEAGCPGL